MNPDTFYNNGIVSMKYCNGKLDVLNDVTRKKVKLQP